MREEEESTTAKSKISGGGAMKTTLSILPPCAHRHRRCPCRRLSYRFPPSDDAIDWLAELLDILPYYSSQRTNGSKSLYNRILSWMKVGM